MKTWGLLLVAAGLLLMLPGLVLLGAVLALAVLMREYREKQVTKLIDGLPDLRTVRPRDRYDLDPYVRAYRRIKKRRRGLGPGLRERPLVLVDLPARIVLKDLPDGGLPPPLCDPSMSWGICQYVPESHSFPVISGYRTVEQQRAGGRRISDPPQPPA